MPSQCVICSKEGLVLVNVTDKGALAISSAAKIRGKKDILENLRAAGSDIKVHVACRKRFTDKRELDKAAKENASKAEEDRPALRSLSDNFDFRKHCLLCADAVASEDDKKKHPDRYQESAVATREILATIKETAQRREDDWGKAVCLRLTNILCLVAAEGCYHRQCHKNFMHPRHLPPPSNKTDVLGIRQPSKGGRKPHEEKRSAFLKLCDYLEANDECQYSMVELEQKMKDLSPTEEFFGRKYLLQKLKGKYGDGFLISSNPGAHDVVCFRGTANKALHQSWHAERRSNVEEERKRIVETAAGIIREEIRMTAYNTESYPPAGTMFNNLSDSIPDLLVIFLSALTKGNNYEQKKDVKSERKCVSIGHAIVSVVRPRSFVSPLQLGLGVMLHRTFASKYLVNSLHSLGFCCSYTEATDYELRAAQHTPKHRVSGSPFVQYIFDNADFNSRTLNGTGTFHAMGGVRALTPASRRPPQRIPRHHAAKLSAINGLMELRCFKDPGKAGFNQVKVVEVSEPPAKKSVRSAKLLDTLWLAAPSFGDVTCPGWNGFLSVTNTGEGKAFYTTTLEALPFLNLDPSNPSTIYSCLMFAAEDCKNFNQKSCVVTFDLPLYMKACQITLSLQSKEDPLQSVVLRLGGFHLLMSYMSAVGSVMAGSGIEELWTTCYAKNSIGQMLGGHAYARSIRAHYLTQLAVINVLLSQQEDTTDSHNDELRHIYSNLLGNLKSPEDVILNPSIRANLKRIEIILEKAERNSRTGRLWVQYCRMVQLIRLFVRAERCGDWQLHLHTVREMHPYFAAAGNIHYAKAVQLYLQSMEQLETKMTPVEYDQFSRQGFFTVRRKQKFCSGTWTDMIIEQFLMRNMKSKGGLTHGRGLSDATIARWVLCLPVACEILEGLETFTCVVSRTSEQHVEMRDSRRTRDRQDFEKLKLWLELHKPFDKPADRLVSLSTGVTGDERVNCDNALERGLSIAAKSMGKTFGELVIHRKDKVVTLADMNTLVKIREVDVPVNPNQLFHRIICAFKGDIRELHRCLTFELSPIPLALFDLSGIRKGTKSALIKALKDLILKTTGEPLPNATLPEKCAVVVDGGYLLHKVVWPRPASFQIICECYVDYVRSHFHHMEHVTIVFDGYDELSTKDEERARRSAKAGCVDISVSDSAVTSVPREVFLSNINNNKNVIALMIGYLEKAGYSCLQASSDADRIIVTTAIQISRDGLPSVVIGEDTDLFVLLIALSKSNDRVYMKIPARSGALEATFYSSQLRSTLKDVREHLLFVHAVSGCDTTSAIYRKGEANALKTLFSSSSYIKEILSIFTNKNASHEDVAKAGEVFLVALYGGAYGTTLDELRPVHYQRTIARQPLHAKFDLATLPPTSASARQHSYRCYLQVQDWLGNSIPAEQWGWRHEQDRLIPVMTTKAPAPDDLLNLISCNCKSACSTVRCDCKKAGLLCTNMCGFCAQEVEAESDVDDPYVTYD